MEKYLLSLGVAVIFVVANVLTKKSLEPGYAWLQWIVSGLAVAAFLAFRHVCQHFGLGIASAMVDGLLTLITIAVAVFLLKETLTPRQIIGVVMILGGLFMVK